MDLKELKALLQDGDRLVFLYGAYIFRKDGKTEPYEITANPAVRSDPPNGFFPVTNLYVDATGKLVIEYDDKLV